MSVRRIHVIGVSGSGKTTLARQAAAILGVGHLELDAVFWQENWTYRNLDDAHARVRAFLQANPDGWVIDGNWTGRLAGLLDPGSPDGPDLVVWPDHPRRVVMWRVVGRTAGRAVRRTELWHGNREDPRSWLRRDPEENILRWSWTQYPRVRERMEQRIAAGEPILRLSGQRAVDEWLTSLTPA